MRTREAMKLIRAAERKYEGLNRTRWYTTIHPKRNREAKVKTWAVKTWKGKPLIMLAAEYNTDGSKNYISGRCLWSQLGGYSFNWLDYGGSPHQAVWSDIDGCRDEWLEQYDHVFGAGIEFWGQLLNDFTGTKYQWAKYETTNLRISDFCELMRISPMTEYVIKGGLRKWLTPRNIGYLKHSRPLALYLSHRIKEFKDTNPVSVIAKFKKHTDPKTAAELNAYVRTIQMGLDKFKFPFKPLRMIKWFNSHKVKMTDFRHHIDNLNELKLSLDYEPHVFPHDWEVYRLEIEDRVREQRELIAEAERQAVIEAHREARETIAKWLKEGRIHKKYSIIIPESETQCVAEGKAMNNCIGGYWASVVSGKTNVAFIHKNNKPYIDIEVKNGKIIQKRYNHNKAVEDGTKDAALCELVASTFKMAA